MSGNDGRRWRHVDRPLLRGTRVDLEPLVLQDADEMTTVLGDPRLYDVMGGSPPDLDALQRRFERLALGRSADGREEWQNWIVRLRPERVAAGHVQATIVESQADIAWVIGVPWQGAGYATEAANAVVAWLGRRGIATITAHIARDHRPSETVAERIGLVVTDEVEDGERVWRRG